MFYENYTNTETRSNSALQVSLYARAQERKQNLQFGGYKAEQAAKKRVERGNSTSFLEKLLTSLHLI
jgi:hypothetical protein